MPIESSFRKKKKKNHDCVTASRLLRCVALPSLSHLCHLPNQPHLQLICNLPGYLNTDFDRLVARLCVRKCHSFWRAGHCWVASYWPCLYLTWFYWCLLVKPACLTTRSPDPLPACLEIKWGFMGSDSIVFIEKAYLYPIGAWDVKADQEKRVLPKLRALKVLNGFKISTYS